MPVTSDRRGPVTTVVLSRPEVRNVVDGPTAEALADAFRRFDADPEAEVAVLWAAGDLSARALTSRRSAPNAPIASNPAATARGARPECG
jgi:enoyl-CoA hydratase/carnithine racemase